MIDWFQRLSAECRLNAEAARALRVEGYAVIEGPLTPRELEEVSAAYDRAVEEASGPDKGVGRTTTRLHDLVNRGAAFDGLYLHPPVLAASCETIRQPFKLSNMLARTLHPRAEAQGLHVDFERDDEGWPMLGFILMVDEFTAVNGATRIVPRSHHGTGGPPASAASVPACGPRGAMVIYNGSVLHGHGRNETDLPRRSIQGAFIRRTAAGFGLGVRMSAETTARIGPLAEYLIAV